MQLTKARLNQSLKGCWGIGEPKGHAFTLPKPSGPMVNAVRGFASSSNSTCQYPDFRSSVEKHTAPCKQSKVSSLLGNEYPSFIVLLFNLHRSIQSLSPPSFFLASTTAVAHGLKLLLTAPTSTISWRWLFTSSYRWGGLLLYLSLKGWGSVIWWHVSKYYICLNPNHFGRRHQQIQQKDCWLIAFVLVSNPSKFSWSKTQDPPFPLVGPCLSCNLEAWSFGTILACCSSPTTALDGMVLDLAKTFLRPTATLLEPGSNMQ